MCGHSNISTLELNFTSLICIRSWVRILFCFLIWTFPGLFLDFLSFLGALAQFICSQCLIRIRNRKKNGSITHCLVYDLINRKSPTPSKNRATIWSEKSKSLSWASLSSNSLSPSVISILIDLARYNERERGREWPIFKKEMTENPLSKILEIRVNWKLFNLTQLIQLKFNYTSSISLAFGSIGNLVRQINQKSDWGDFSLTFDWDLLRLTWLNL